MSATRDELRHRLVDPAQVVIADGAMGTVLYAKGVFINQCYDELNVRQPDLVRGIHADYVRAGAELLETNSFGANRPKLQHYGLEANVREFNVAAATLARDAAGEQALVAGAVGPLGLRIEPYGPTSREEAQEFFAEQMRALREGGVDCFILETFSDLNEIAQAVKAARAVDPALPVIAQMTVGPDGVTSFGVPPEEVAEALEESGADIIGLNCSVGPQTILEAIERMVPVTSKKLSAMPNAGMPREVSGRRMYMASPEYMSTYARNLIQAGVRLIGGCCGTTPDHIRAMVDGVRPLVPRHATVEGSAGGGRLSRVAAHHESHAVQPVALGERSAWGRKLAAGAFVTSVEIVPPRGVEPSRMLDEVRKLKAAGVDAVNVPDGPRAQSRMSAIATSVLIQQACGIETVTHYACRDRNLLGMLSDLLGASALGLHNVLLVTGDPPKMGPYPDATAVFDIDAIGLTNLVSRLNHGVDPGGNSIGAPTRYVIGVGVNPVAIDVEHELKRFAWKVEAGAEFAVTQPVFDTEQLESFVRRIEEHHLPVVAGIWPLVSVRNAEFLANEVPGVTVPSAVIERMGRANEKSKDHAVAEGIAIAREMLDRVRPVVQGVQVSAPFGKVELALDVFRT
ncbi:MAG TPA: bifunctional homocysteine S-methyltransferase/methylenetetrahydrofolate reductase [Gemmatimonadaceae bacterium]|jgi:homocysteine S-methyltransferase